jgi:Family of unknown function (DUF5362)
MYWQLTLQVTRKKGAQMDTQDRSEFSGPPNQREADSSTAPATTLSDGGYGNQPLAESTSGCYSERNCDANEGWFERLSLPLYESRGWLKFLSVISIGFGVLQALTVIGILWAWLPIWCGILLWQAAESAERARLGNDALEFELCLRKVKNIVTMFGIVAIISISFSFLGFLFMFLTGGLAILSEYMSSF